MSENNAPNRALMTEDMIPLRDYLLRIMDERDRAYQQRFDATQIANQQRFDAAQMAIKDALAAQEKAVMTAMVAAEKAVTKAENAAEKRFEAVNEFRKTLSDQTSTFITRIEFAASLRGMADKIEASIASMATRIDDLKAFRDQSTGKGTGTAMMWGIALGLVSIGVLIINVFTFFKH